MAKKKLSRTHKVVLKVTFNRPCSASDAVSYVKDNIHGDFYPTQHEYNAPDEFTVRGAMSLKAAMKSAAAKA